MKKLLLLCFCAAMTLFISCQKEADPVAPTPQTQDNVNSGQCPDCRLWTCTNRLHDICGVCGISRRPPRGCLCTAGGGIDQPEEIEGDPVPPGTPVGAYLVKPDNCISLSSSRPSQIRTVYYNGGGYWKKCMGVIRVSYDYPIIEYLSLPESSDEEGTLIFKYPTGIVIPSGGISGNYMIGGDLIGQISIKP